MLRVLNDGASLEDWNKTLVTLIPKIKDPLILKNFKPISLCNVCFKIVSRAITNRFRPILSKIIETSKRSFISGRLISDNIIVGFEILHWMRSRSACRCGYAALKLDTSKAYDRVEWNFLELMMLRLGFDNYWAAWVMNCITSVSYYFRFSQDIVGPINPGRGLRQGDPLFSIPFYLVSAWFIYSHYCSWS